MSHVYPHPANFRIPTTDTEAEARLTAAFANPGPPLEIYHELRMDGEDVLDAFQHTLERYIAIVTAALAEKGITLR